MLYFYTGKDLITIIKRASFKKYKRRHSVLYQTQVLVKGEETTVPITLYEVAPAGSDSKSPMSQKLSYIEKILHHPFDNNPKRVVLIEGIPGIGKTTLCLDIVNSWTQSELISCEVLLLILLRDPNVQKISTVQEFSEYFMQSASEANLLNDYLENKGSVTIILDGFDEMNSELRNFSFFSKLIKGDYLPKAKIVVTSRPSASAWLHDVVDQRVEILGFYRSSREKYITESLKKFPLWLEKLQKHLQQYPNIDAMCYTPSVISIIVFIILHQPEELPPTITKMYHIFIVYKICDYLKAQNMIPKDKTISEMQQFPPVVQETLQQLQQFAFRHLVEDKYVFTSKEVPKDSFGLLESVEHHSNAKSYNFIHFSVQEFLAACYVANLPTVEKDQVPAKESFIKKANSSEDIHFYNMWIFYCGFTSENFRCAPLQCKQYYSTDLFQSSMPFQPNSDCFHQFFQMPSDPQLLTLTIPRLLSHSGLHVDILQDCNVPVLPWKLWYFIRSNHKEPVTICTTPEIPVMNSIESSEGCTFPQEFFNDTVKILHMFQCFKEAQNDMVCEVLSKKIHGNAINLKDHKLIVPCQVESLGLFLTNTNCTELILFNCQIGDYGINILQRYLCRDAKKNHHIATIDFMQNGLTEASLPLIGDIIVHVQPHTLQLGCNNFACVKDITNAVITFTVRVLNLFGCNITSQEATAISDMTAVLEELNVSNNNLSDDGAKVLSEGLTKTKSLRVLYINNNNIDSQGIVSIAYALSLNTSLAVLNMTNNIIRQDGAAAIAEAIMKNKTLEELLLWGSRTLNEESAILLLEKLYNGNSSITKLGFPKKLASNNCIKNYIESINIKRRSCGQQDVKFELY